MLMNRKLAQVTADAFGYEAGRDPEAEPAIGSFRLDDDDSMFR